MIYLIFQANLDEAGLSNQCSLASSHLCAQEAPGCTVCLQAKQHAASERKCPSQLGEGLQSRAVAGDTFRKLILVEKHIKPLYEPEVA